MASIIQDRVTLWTLEAKYFGKVDVGSTLMLEALRFTLESNDILKWLNVYLFLYACGHSPCLCMHALCFKTLCGWRYFVFEVVYVSN